MGRRILIVDDSSMMRNMIKKVLTGEGHEIIGEAKNGKDAVKMYKSLSPDLVTMDITMRDMDGFAAAREIIALDRNARIIFLSNLDQDKYSDEAKKIGALGYINKHKTREIITLIENS